MKFQITLFAGWMLSMAMTDALCQQTDKKLDADYKLIAHRGGVVDSTSAENNLSALREAVKEGTGWQK